MSDDLQNINDLIPELEGLAIRTTQGSFVKMEDVRRLIEKRTAAKEIQNSSEPQPKTVEQARAQAKRFLVAQVDLKPPTNLGRSIPATDPHPSSRT